MWWKFFKDRTKADDIDQRIQEVKVSNIHRSYNRARLDDRQINELVGIARTLTADGVVTQAEAEFLQTWLYENRALTLNPLISGLFDKVTETLKDGFLDKNEPQELLETLKQFSGGNCKASTTLPLDKPQPQILFPQQKFCLTGLFSYGSRKACEEAIISHGGLVGSLTQTTNYLVIGTFVSDAWSHSSFGRKIEKAADMKASGIPIKIVCEEHWHTFLS